MTNSIGVYWKKSLQIIQSGTLRSISLLISSNFLASVAGFASSIITLKHLSSTEIALLYPLVSILLISDQLGDLGLSVSLTKIASSYWATQRRKADKVFHAVFKTKMMFALTVSFLGMIFAKLIAKKIFKSEEATPWIQATFFFSLLSMISSIFQVRLQVEGKFRRYSFVRFIPHLIKLAILVLILLAVQRRFEISFAAFMCVPIFSLLFAFFLANKSFLKAKSTPDELHEVFHFSKWIVFSTVTVSFIGQLDLLMLKTLSTADEVARFIGGQRIAGILPVFTGSIVTVLLPKVASYKTKADLRRYLRKSLHIVPPLVIITAICTPLAKYIIPAVLGTKYVASVPVFQIFCVQFSIDVFVTIFSLVLYNLNKLHILAAMNISQLLLNAVANYVLIPRYGAVGAAISAALLRIFALFVVIITVRRQKLA